MNAIFHYPISILEKLFNSTRCLMPAMTIIVAGDLSGKETVSIFGRVLLVLVFLHYFLVLHEVVFSPLPYLREKLQEKNTVLRKAVYGIPIFLTLILIGMLSITVAAFFKVVIPELVEVLRQFTVIGNSQ
mgnify:CR=1 FL=1|tara:strand:- start:4850 stop:5239 length:390 start_codon:yes stop_codon:yes gene_type:complete